MSSKSITALCFAATALVASVPGPSQAAAACTPSLVDLGTLGGAYSVATAIDDKGAVVGYSPTAQGIEHAFVFRQGSMADVTQHMPLDLRGKASRADAINGAGQIGGSIQVGSNQPDYFGQVWRYTPATKRFDISPVPIYLGDPFYCAVTGLAADGSLVGRGTYSPYVAFGFVGRNPDNVYAKTDGDTSAYPLCSSYHPVMNTYGDVTWQGAGGGSPDGNGGDDAYSRRYGDYWYFNHAPKATVHGLTRAYVTLKRLNDDLKGAATAYDVQVCGYRWTAEINRRALVFNATTQKYRDLGPGLFGNTGQSAAYAVSEGSLLIAGISVPEGPACEVKGTATLFAKLGSGGKGTVVNVAPAGDVTESQALAVTRRGQVLGDALLGTERKPFVYSKAGGARWLDTLFPEMTLVETNVFQNERGQIGGTGLISGQRHAFRIDCATGS